MHLTNFTCFTEPETTLFEEEINAITAIVAEVIRLDSPHERGSFLLMGQADGADAQTLISFDLALGAANNYRRGANSADEARRVLEYGVRAEKNRSHISYFIDTELFLTLNTTAGRFLCACYCENSGYGFQRKVYITVATALACMGKEDAVLQDSLAVLLQNEKTEITRTSTYVREMFASRALPELVVWHKWHESANSCGKLTLFFQ